MVQLDFTKSKDGLITAVTQDWQTGDVLMLAHMNEEAWRRTLATGVATYWSRSRNQLWIKGETSGNIQKVKEILVDCDQDAVVLKVEQLGGAACHEGYRSCFFRRVEGETLTVTGSRVFDPRKVYG
jgi:phosphoribosyl-AMP cyclohydrolase